MKSLIEAQLVNEIAKDHQRSAKRRFARASSDALVIRKASPADSGPLHHLALLDSAPQPHGPMLVAEREGMLVAAVPLGGGRPIADPCVPSADIVGLLELRRAQLRPA